MMNGGNMEKPKHITVRLKPEEITELKLMLPKVIELHQRQEFLTKMLSSDLWEAKFRERRMICERLYKLFVRL